MKYAFVAKHRPLFPVRTMCRCLRIQPSGFYAWLKAPMSKRAKEDVRQTELIRKAWKDSSKVYGYRMTIFWIRVRRAVRTVLRVWPVWQASRLRSATGAGQGVMAANRHWSSTTLWTGSSMWMRQTGFG